MNGLKKKTSWMLTRKFGIRLTIPFDAYNHRGKTFYKEVPVIMRAFRDGKWIDFGVVPNLVYKKDKTSVAFARGELEFIEERNGLIFTLDNAGHTEHAFIIDLSEAERQHKILANHCIHHIYGERDFLKIHFKRDPRFERIELEGKLKKGWSLGMYYSCKDNS